MAREKAALIILDGYGQSSSPVGNAVLKAKTPNLDKLFLEYPHTTIKASGLSVGLPEGQMGNSEVGHLNLGAGRIVYQDITRIDKSIADGDFFTNKAFLGAINFAKKNNGAVHLVGLCSDGGVHSHINHLYALLELCKKQLIKTVYIHCITDGRDVPPASAVSYVCQVEEKAKELGVGEVVSVIGRYYYMDRDNRWERVEVGYRGVFEAEGEKTVSFAKSIQASYDNKVFDEFIKPIIKEGYRGVNNTDSMIFYNFRSDRAREISQAIIDKDFSKFEKPLGHKKIFYVGLTEYDETFKGIETAFPKRDIKDTLGEVLSKNGLIQARVAETEKYAHVTFFFNGGIETPNKNEKRVLIPSPKVATYDLLPQMSAFEVASAAIQEIDESDVLILNFANCDMVGHTGVFDAAVKAVETVDVCVGRVVDKILKMGGFCIITADHGNAELMHCEKGNIHTAHTTFAVPLILVSEKHKNIRLKQNGTLASVAPTLLELLKIKKPNKMEGESLII